MKRISSADNNQFKALLRLAHSSRERRKQGLSLLDGVHLVAAYRENAGNALGASLSEVLLPEIAEDRQTLERLMAVVGVSPSRSKVAVAWAAEKAGRLKPNGKLWRYSPLSRLLELEGLAAGIEAKRALWLALASAYDEDGSARAVNGVQDKGRRGTGAIYVFGRSGTTWSQQAYLKASNPDPGDR